MPASKFDAAWESAAHAWRVFAETANPNTQHNEKLGPAELRQQAIFESIDYHKSYPQMYIDHLRATDKRNNPLHVVAHTPTGQASPSDPLSHDNSSTAGEDFHGHHTTASSGGMDGSLAASVSSVFGNLFNEKRARSAASAIVEEVTAYDASSRNSTLRWLLHVLIALSVGLIAAAITYTVAAIDDWRFDSLYHIVVDRESRSLGYFLGLLFWCGSSFVMIFVATIAVVWFEPAAGGSGIPDVIAYLNGVMKPKVVNLRTFVGKTVSCVFAVAGGLPVGVEAPLIHLGAIAGAGVTQGRSRTLGCQTRLFQAFRNNKDRRDFITAGAACGVSAAFGAPIGGLLFVMEEVSSFWDHSASGQVFLASMISFSTIALINSMAENDHTIGRVTNSAAVLFEVNVRIPLNLVAVFPSLFFGALCGVLAVIFTKCNLIIIRWRRRVIRPYWWRRLAEPLVIVSLFSFLMYVVALMPGCQPTFAQVPENITTGWQPWNTENVSTLVNLTCHERDTYSPLATLALSSGNKVIRHLFNRQTVSEFPAGDVFLHFLFYTVFACWSSGTFVATGLVIPTMVMGASFGRLFGLFLVHAFSSSSAAMPNAYLVSESWMDPGMFALIGAGALLGGINRMAMSICVIMVELSGELHYLLPIMVAIVMSKATADWLCEPLFHVMLHLDSVPYLPMHLPKEFEQLTAADVMTPNVVTLRVRESTSSILHALRTSTHHAFPVLAGDEDTIGDEGRQASTVTSPLVVGATPSTTTSMSRPRHTKFIGVVTREDIQVFLSLPSLQNFASHQDDAATPTGPQSSTTTTNGLLQTPLAHNAQLSPHQAHPSATAPVATANRPQPSSAESGESSYNAKRLDVILKRIKAMSWVDWMRHQTSLFFVIGDKQWHSNWTRTNTPDAVAAADDASPSTLRTRTATSAAAASLAARDARNPYFVDEQQLPPFVDLSLIVNRSPWVIPPFFNLSMAYTTFRSMGLRHMVVVDGDAVCGMITRKDIVINSLRGHLLGMHMRIREAAMAERTRRAIERARADEQEAILASQRNPSVPSLAAINAAAQVGSGNAGTHGTTTSPDQSNSYTNFFS